MDGRERYLPTPAEPRGDEPPRSWAPLVPEVVGREPEWRYAPPPPRRKPRRLLHLVLFLLTCASTYVVQGPVYAAAVMTILLAHEFGHYLQARRYDVPASLPYFIPMPITLFGTMGAVITMRSRINNNRALFDVAITGPIAGLIPALVCSFVGLRLSTVEPVAEATAREGYVRLGEPIIFKLLSRVAIGPVPDGYDVMLHPLAFAGWVGIFITALNMIPIGQLDGGHILFALLKGRSDRVSMLLLTVAVGAVVIGGYWQWSLMLVILVLIGARHPPVEEVVPLGPVRVFLGWLMLLFIVLGLTPEPFIL